MNHYIEVRIGRERILKNVFLQEMGVGLVLVLYFLYSRMGLNELFL